MRDTHSWCFPKSVSEAEIEPAKRTDPVYQRVNIFTTEKQPTEIQITEKLVLQSESHLFTIIFSSLSLYVKMLNVEDFRFEKL